MPEREHSRATATTAAANLDKLRSIVKASEKIVFFGGAGVSTESGIPDFRGTDGLYNTQYKYPPEMILSHSFFMREPAEFYRFYRDKMLFLYTLPNGAHATLAKWEGEGKVSAVVTQNIDGLHQMAGSRRVYELHGSVHRNFCMKCRKTYPVEFIAEGEGVPYCSCGGIVKPDVVLYEEPLNQTVLREAAEAVSEADTLMVGGTSLNVYPAASLVDFYRGSRLVLINRTGLAAFESRANLVIQGNIGEVLSDVVDYR
jgi:NAD-dependent deacetylase